jgi:membrane fusion protein, multidrug efflux system
MELHAMSLIMKKNMLRATAIGFAAAGLLIAATLQAADAPKVVEVKTAKPTRGEVFRFVTLPGTLKANQQATLYAKVAGYLKSLSVDKGDRVTAGQSLGEIEVPELEAEAVKYRAEIKVAESDFKRLSAAQKSSAELITAQAVDEAGGRLDIARANLERTETLLRYSKLTAPFNGIVTMRYVDPGAFIPSATSGSAAQTAAIVTLADFNTIRVQVAVPELEAALVRTDQVVRLTTESLPGKVFEGKISRMSYALDDATRTMLIEADLPNPELTLRPGMYATARVGVEKHADAMRIPSEALVMEKASAFAFVVEGGKAKKTALKIGFNDGTNAEVLTGLRGDATVILVGKMAIVDGAAVNGTEAK